MEKQKSPLRKERERRGWSRDFVAEKIGSDQQSVARWERGEYYPTPHLRQQLCTLFQLDAETLGLIKPPTTREEEQQHEPASTGLPTQPTLPTLPNTPIPQLSPELLTYISELSKKTAHHLPDAPPPHKQSALKQQRVLIGGSLLVLLTIIGVFVLFHDTIAWLDTRILPGGMWLTPDDGQTVGTMLHFAAHAFPTNPTDPPIEYVKFTIRSGGHWSVACIATPPKNSDIFSCTADLLQLRTIPGNIEISFDVYDHKGNYHLAPNGTRHLHYTQQTSPNQ